MSLDEQNMRNEGLLYRQPSNVVSLEHIVE